MPEKEERTQVFFLADEVQSWLHNLITKELLKRVQEMADDCDANVHMQISKGDTQKASTYNASMFILDEVMIVAETGLIKEKEESENNDS